LIRESLALSIDSIVNFYLRKEDLKAVIDQIKGVTSPDGGEEELGKKNLKKTGTAS
jgi:hypothetical protein